MPKGPREKSRGPFFVREAKQALTTKAMQHVVANQGAASMLELTRLALDKHLAPQESAILSNPMPLQGVRHFSQAQLPYQDC